MNFVPRSGGNTFSGQSFFNTAGEWSSGNNLDDFLRGIGIPEPAGIINSYDASVSLGGPIMRDRLWFFGSYRKLTTAQRVEGIFGNAYAFDPSHWDYLRDDSLSVRDVQGRTMYQGAVHRAADAEESRHVLAGEPVPLPGFDGDNQRGTAAARAATTGSRWDRPRCRRRRAIGTSTSRTT